MKKIIIGIAGILIILAGLYLYVTFFDQKHAEGNQKTIMAFGDSLTYGKGDRREQGYIGKLEKKLNDKQTGTEYKIENYGVRGRESSGILKELGDIKTADHLNETDYFIVFIGTNDLRHGNGGDYKPLHHDKIQQAKEDYLDNMKAILKILETANEKAPIIVLGLYNPYPDGEKIEKYIYDWNLSTQKLVKSHNQVTYISTDELFKGKEKKNYFSDSLHLNEKGYGLISDKILRSYDFK